MSFPQSQVHAEYKLDVHCSAPKKQLIIFPFAAYYIITQGMVKQLVTKQWQSQSQNEQSQSQPSVHCLTCCQCSWAGTGHACMTDCVLATAGFIVLHGQTLISLFAITDCSIVLHYMLPEIYDMKFTDNCIIHLTWYYSSHVYTISCYNYKYLLYTISVVKYDNNNYNYESKQSNIFILEMSTIALLYGIQMQAILRTW